MFLFLVYYTDPIAFRPHSNEVRAFFWLPEVIITAPKVSGPQMYTKSNLWACSERMTRMTRMKVNSKLLEIELRSGVVIWLYTRENNFHLVC